MSGSTAKLTLGVGGHVEVAPPEERNHGRRLTHLLLDVEADLTATGSISHIPTVSYGMGIPRFLKVNAKPSGTPASRRSRTCLRPRLLDIAPVAASFSSSWGAWPRRYPATWMPADFANHGDLGQVPGGLVAVRGQGERAADALVVEGLALVIDGHEREQSHALSCTAIFGPRAWTRLSRSEGVKPTELGVRRALREWPRPGPPRRR